MSQKVITVPKTKKAQELLDVDQATEDELIEWDLSKEEQLLLIDNGVFDLINKASGVNIDDHEDEAVVGRDKLEQACAALSKKKAALGIASGAKTIDRLLVLFEEARQRETGVYFYF